MGAGRAYTPVQQLSDYGEDDKKNTLDFERVLLHEAYSKDGAHASSLCSSNQAQEVLV